MAPERLLSLNEAAARLGIDCPHILRRHRNKWGIPWVKVGQEIKFRESDVEAWISDRAAPDAVAAAVRRTVEAAPLLTAAQRDELRALLDTAAVP